VALLVSSAALLEVPVSLFVSCCSTVFVAPVFVVAVDTNTFKRQQKSIHAFDYFNFIHFVGRARLQACQHSNPLPIQFYDSENSALKPVPPQPLKS
jgi:hypothetical protein